MIKALAGLALRKQRIEFLFEPLLGGFAGVDGAANPRVPLCCCLPVSCACWSVDAVDAAAFLFGGGKREPERAPAMSATCGNSEKIYSLRVLPPVTQSGPSGDAERARWVATLQRTPAHSKWDFRWSRSFGRPLKPTFHHSVGSPSSGWDSLAKWAQCAIPLPYRPRARNGVVR